MAVFRPRAGKWTHFLPLNNKFLHFWSAIETLYYEEKSFTQACNLRKHIKTIHEGHKDYKCEFCEKSFSA